ncbi:MAG: heme exporter protein CcmB [Gemmatimonadota bacterium]
MSLRAELRRTVAVAGKDLLAEGRAWAGVASVILFAATALLLFGFALGPDVEALRQAGPGVLWLGIFFSGILVLNRSYQVELEGGALEALLGYPGDRRAIFAGKLLANLSLVFLVEAILLPMTVVLFHFPLENGTLGILAVMGLGTLGFVTLGTFYAAMSSRSRAREVLLPLLLFPMLVPVLVAAVQGTGAFLDGNAMGYGGAWLRLLLAFDIIFLVATFWAFEHVIGE